MRQPNPASKSVTGALFSIDGDRERSLLQETLARLDGFAPPLVICNQEHRFLVAEQLHGTALVAREIVMEPVG